MDLATLLNQLYQHVHIMDNILKATYIPTNITDAGQAHCKEYLGRALDHMIKMGGAFRSISVQHPQDLDTHEVMAASAKQELLLAQFTALTTTLGERTQARPKHSINTISYSSNSPQQSLPNNQMDQPSLLPNLQEKVTPITTSPRLLAWLVCPLPTQPGPAHSLPWWTTLCTWTGRSERPRGSLCWWGHVFATAGMTRLWPRVGVHTGLCTERCKAHSSLPPPSGTLGCWPDLLPTQPREDQDGDLGLATVALAAESWDCYFCLFVLRNPGGAECCNTMFSHVCILMAGFIIP
jgi:hypothetical protein